MKLVLKVIGISSPIMITAKGTIACHNAYSAYELLKHKNITVNAKSRSIIIRTVKYQNIRRGDTGRNTGNFYKREFWVPF